MSAIRIDKLAARMVVVFAAAWVGGFFSAWAQDIDNGQAEFVANCAGCHGPDGKGSGPHSADLKIKPADLTSLAKRTNGQFDPGAVYQMIDGRNARFAHRSADMPVWGCRHDDRSNSVQAAKLPTTSSHVHRLRARHKSHGPGMESLLDLPCDSEAVIRGRILSIVGYLSLIQER